MPRFWTFSDLHQEWPDNGWDPALHAPHSGFDAVLAAGDVASPLTSALDWLHDRVPGSRVLYTPGNHDFWCDPNGDDRYTYDDQVARGRDRAARYGIDLLLDDTVVVDGVRVIGSTLWTDLHLSPFPLTCTARNAEKRMRDYRRIRRRLTGHHKYITARDTLSWHRAARNYVIDALGHTFDGPTLVMTHHAPSAWSLNADASDLPFCYASALDDLVAGSGAATWVHGHIHGRADYRLGDTRVRCNAMGHIEQVEARTAFDPSLVLTL